MARVERESINFKLPKSLVEALKAAAKERNTTATDLVIQGLYHVLGPAPGTEVSIETRLHNLETQLTAITNRQEVSVESGVEDSSKQRLSLLEQKTEAIAQQLAKIEGAIASTNNQEAKLEELSHKLARFEGALIQMQSSINASRSRNKSSSYPYQNSAPPKLEPKNQEQLAMRLGTTDSTLLEKRATLSQKDFELWTKERDLSNYSWRFNEKDKLYHPIK
jgi:uncharacterized protein (DUF1778 family)/uncharacterized coiled-coil protein SlyX